MPDPVIISIVTLNRKDILSRVLDAILETTRAEQPILYVSDNGSTDGTVEMLHDRKRAGELQAWYLRENLGTDIARNHTHWARCLGRDTVRMDDKCLPTVPGWLTALQRQSREHNALVGVPYDLMVQHLWQCAPCLDYVRWDVDQGRGGPVMFIPAAATAALGGCDELFPDHRYGWTDVLYIERARLLGFEYGFSLRAPFEFLAHADPSRRNSAMEWHGLYLERLREYQEAERDVYVQIGEGGA